MASNTAGDIAYDVLETPTLDSESPNLLLQISEQGGYAYVSMSVLAAAGDLRAAEATREMAWEQLHSGPWHSVLPVWRDAYSMACLYVAKLHHRAGDFGEALKVLDMGLIMGGTLLRQDLHAAVEKVTAKASELRVSEEEQGEVIVGGENAYHEAEVRFVPFSSSLFDFSGKWS